MNKRHQNKRWNFFLIFLSVLLTVAIVDACRKIDHETAGPENPNKPTTTEGILTKFLTVPTNADQKVKAIAKSIEHQNEMEKFIEDLVKRVGYPRWDKVMIASNDGISHRSATDEDSNSIVYIPFVIPDSLRTACILAVGLDYTPGDTIFHMIYPSQYKYYGFDSTSVGWDARNVFHLFTELDHSIFGYDTIDITDGRFWGGEPEESGTIVRTSEAGTGNKSQLVVITVCNTFTPKAGFKGGIGGRTGSMGWTGPTTICSEFLVSDPQEPGPLEFPDAGGGGSNGGGSGNGSSYWHAIPPCDLERSASTESGELECSYIGWIYTYHSVYDWNGLAYYDEWGYHHFETAEVSEEDEESIDFWKENNIDTVGLNPCVREILHKLMGSNNIIGKILVDLDRAAGRTPDIEKFYLRFRTGTLPYGVGAKTTTGILNPVDHVYSDTITINNDGGLDSLTQLGMAKNIIHEIIHSYMNSILKRHYNVANPNQILADSVWDAYVDTLMAIHTRQDFRNWVATHANGDFDHNFMAERLLESMALALAYVDDSRNTFEFYWGLSWGGLYESRPIKRVWRNSPSWPPTSGYAEISEDSTRGLKYALTAARLDSITSWVSRERHDTTKAKGRKHQSTGCYGN